MQAKSKQTNAGAISFIVILATSAALAAPQQVSQSGQLGSPVSSPSSLSTTTQASSTTASSRIASTTSAPSVNTAQPGISLTSSASVANGSPSLVRSLPPGSAIPAPLKSGTESAGSDDFDIFDGKNPFADDSLWQIPVNLARELDAPDTADDKVSKLAPGTADSRANVDEEEDSDDGSPVSPSQTLSTSSSSSPAVISASTGDLKTAADYHYPTHGHHYGYDGHHADPYGHHGATHYSGQPAGTHDHHNYHHGKYFQYASVPYPHAWEFGYRKGNPYHTIERYEHGKGPHFQTKVKWSDKHGGYGVHVWDYNHDDHHSHHYDDDHHYDSHTPAHNYGQAGHHGQHGQQGAHYGYH